MKNKYKCLFHLKAISSTFAWIFLLFFILLTCDVKISAQVDSSVAPQKFGYYTPNLGFRVLTTDKAVLNFRLYTYVRYLNQKNIDSVYTNLSGTQYQDPRQDVQINKVALHFYGWIMSPKLRYLLYVWTNNTAQGQGAQVVVAGNMHYDFNKYLTVGAGISSLPGVRSTEGNFPYWLSVDNRPIADEFFRPSYTSGIWARGNLLDNLKYDMMLGNNLSQLGVDAGQLDDEFNTFAGALMWFPTTGEYGLSSSYGDLENHQSIATRLAAHYSRSNEDRQGVPSTEAFENVTIRLSDGSVIFAPNVFGQGVQLNKARYQMVALDAGAKYKGIELEGEFYLRDVDKFKGRGTDTLGFNKLHDTGFQFQASAMVIKQSLQVYSIYSQVLGEYGDPYDLRFGVNWYPYKNHVIRWNFELINTYYIPVGGLSLPYPVGAKGNIFHTDFEVNF